MGIRSRAKRLENFEQRASDFTVALMEGVEGEEYRMVKRDGKTIAVGAGNHRRLTQKRNPLHLRLAQELQDELTGHLRSSCIMPKHYVLEPAKMSLDTGIMEYFHRPSMAQLRDYLSTGEDAAGGWESGRRASVGGATQLLTREERLLCKALLGQFPGISSEGLEVAGRELDAHLSNIGRPMPGFEKSNVMVLGQAKDGRIRLAIVDV